MDTDPFCLSGISPSMGRSIMYCRCGHKSVVTDSSPETGEVSQSDRGVDKTDFRFPFSPFRLSYMQLAVPNVVAIAVRMVITMLRILPQVELLLNVPIVVI